MQRRVGLQFIIYLLDIYCQNGAVGCSDYIGAFWQNNILIINLSSFFERDIPYAYF
jgi:hypothetical protein